MRVGIELFDLIPGTNQGINVYSETCVFRENMDSINFKRKLIQVFISSKMYVQS